jgi:hypothetical protein
MFRVRHAGLQTSVMPLYLQSSMQAGTIKGFRRRMRGCSDLGGRLGRSVRRWQVVLLETNLGLPVVPGGAGLLAHILSERLRVDGEAHSVHAVVHVLAGAGNGAGELRGQGEGGAADVVRVEGVGEGGVGDVVVDAVVDEVALASGSLLDGDRRAGREGTSGDGVHTDAVLAASLPGEGLGVGLELGLGRGHAAAIAGHNALRGNEGERDAGAAGVHDLSEVVHHGHHGVGGCRGGSKVASAAGLKERLGHLRAVGERVDKDIDLAVFRGHLGGARLDVVALQACIALVVLHVVGDLRGVGEHGIKGEDIGDLHVRAVEKLLVLTEALAEAALEKGEHGRPGADHDCRSRVCQLLRDCPAVASRVRHTRDESHLAGQIDVVARHPRAGSRLNRPALRGLAEGGGASGKTGLGSDGRLGADASEHGCHAESRACGEEGECRESCGRCNTGHGSGGRRLYHATGPRRVC